MKSIIESASDSISSLESYSSYISRLSCDPNVYAAYSPAIVDPVPIIVSPGMNPDMVVPIPTFATLSIFVSTSQDLTLASVSDV